MNDTNTSTTFQPADEFIITSLETLKVFSDPLRQQIIEALIENTKTVKQIAAELSLVPTKLYYHINLLEEHSIIVVAETRIISGIIEKRYGIASRNFYIARTLLSPGETTSNQALNVTLASFLDRTHREIRTSIENEIINTTENAPVHSKLLMMRGRARLTKEQAEDFYTRLHALMKEFEAITPEAKTPDQAVYVLNVSLYPSSKSAADDDTAH